jgi:dGTPase
MTLEARAIVEELFRAFMLDVDLLPPEWRDQATREDPAAQQRRIADYIAGMTDKFAMETHARLAARGPTHFP